MSADLLWPELQDAAVSRMGSYDYDRTVSGHEWAGDRGARFIPIDTDIDNDSDAITVDFDVIHDLEDEEADSLNSHTEAPRAYDPMYFLTKYWGYCQYCTERIPRMTPMREYCLACSGKRLDRAWRIIPWHKLVPVEDVRWNLFSMLAPFEGRPRARAKFLLRQVLCQFFSPFRHMAVEFRRSEPPEWIYMPWLMEDMWTSPSILDYLLGYV